MNSVNTTVTKMQLKMILLFVLIPFAMSLEPRLRVAVVGGGISGTSTAYYLNELFGDDVKVDLYEADAIGGRLSSVVVDGEEYETGGAIIHNRNKYATQLMEQLNLNKKVDSDDDILGLYDGNDFVFLGSRYSWINSLKLFWTYGYDLIRLDKYTNDMLSIFDRIYDIQAKNEAFLRLSDLMRSISDTFLKYMSVSTHEGFIKAGLSERTVEELVSATIKCNYGQTTSVHQFVGSVSVAGGGAELFSVEGGNKRLPEELLKASKAHFYNESVLKVSLQNSSKYTVETSNHNNEYDIVVISTPLTEDSERANRIEFEGFGVERLVVPGSYHITVCTIVKGILNVSFFGLRSNSDTPGIIISVDNNVFFNSVGKIDPVRKIVSKSRSEMGVWKIFSSDNLSDVELEKLFYNYTVISSIRWLAYPNYSIEKSYDSFILHNNMYYTNTMEFAASSIETSIIGARNVALSIYNFRGRKGIPIKHIVREEL